MKAKTFNFKRYGIAFCKQFAIPVSLLKSRRKATTESLEIESSFLRLWISQTLLPVVSEVDIDVHYKVKNSGILRIENVYYYSANIRYLIGSFYYLMNIDGEVKLLCYRLTKEFKEYLDADSLATVAVVGSDSLEDAHKVWYNSIYNQKYLDARYHRVTRATLYDNRERADAFYTKSKGKSSAKYQRSSLFSASVAS